MPALVVILAAAATTCSSPGRLRGASAPPLLPPVVPTDPSAKLSPSLAEALATVPEERHLSVAVDLVDRLDLASLTEAPGFRDLRRRERRRRVVSALETVATTQQRRLAPILDELAARGEVVDWRGFHAVNRIVAEATPLAVRELAARPEVARLRPVRRGRGGVFEGGPTAGAGERRSWGPAAVGAEAAWAAGLTGRGVVVGIVNAGASAAHRQLAPNYAGRWHDAAGLSPHPLDRALGHGSGVLSVAVGANQDGVVLGVAPEAGWVACAAFPRGVFEEALFLDCADWMLRDAGPDVLINAWLLPADDEPCDPSLRAVIEAWRAAEILPVFAAGNLGGGEGNNRAPANYAGLLPDGGAVLAVGALGRGGEPRADSAAGPNRCGTAPFPSLLAPGEGVIAALPLTTSAYVDADGTSYAAGLAAGAAALLYQRYPEASVPEIEAALRRGAVDLGPPGPDPRSGYGRLDLAGALETLDRLRGEAAKRAARSRATQPAAHR